MDDFCHVRRLCCDALYEEPSTSTVIGVDGKLKLSPTDQTMVYGLMQCALVGSCKATKPPAWSSACTRSRWESWHGLGEMDSELAKARIVDFIQRVPGYKRPTLPPPTLVSQWSAWIWGSVGARAEMPTTESEDVTTSQDWSQARVSQSWRTPWFVF